MELLGMRFLANIVSFISMILGVVISFLNDWLHIVNDSAAAVAGILGLAGAIVWLRIAVNKRKESKENLKNAILEGKIKQIQLSNLEKTEG